LCTHSGRIFSAKLVQTTEREHMFYDAQETSHKATREVFSCRLYVAILSKEHSLASLTGANSGSRYKPVALLALHLSALISSRLYTRKRERERERERERFRKVRGNDLRCIQLHKCLIKFYHFGNNARAVVQIRSNTKVNRA